jgi:uncharacterized protein
MTSADQKLKLLRTRIRSYRSAVVAFSGGADSTLVAKIATDELGEKALAATISSPLYPASELQQAKKVAKHIGIKHVVIPRNPLLDRGFTSNPRDRCYVCKLDDLSELWKVAKSRGFAQLLDGSNAEDLHDYRPGLKAKEELKVKSPLAELGLTKRDVRALSKVLKLPTSDKSSSPCLASRIPYGETITLEKLRRIEEAEEFLKAKGFDGVRVRMHGETARIEVRSEDIARLAAAGARTAVSKRLRALGFAYVTLDLEGYRMGSLNEVILR